MWAYKRNLFASVFLFLLTGVLLFSCNEDKLEVKPLLPPPPPPPVQDTLHINPNLVFKGYAPIDNRIGFGDLTKDTLLLLANMHEGIWDYRLQIESYTEMGELVVEGKEIKLANLLKAETWIGFSDKDSIEINLYLSSDTFNIENQKVSLKIKNEMYCIRTWRDLQCMNYDLKGNYVLGNDIIFPERATEGFPEQGFIPVGTGGPDGAPTLNAFKGSLNGYGFKIKNFFIDRKNINYVGLFGMLANTSDIKDFSIILADRQDDACIQGGDYVGGIAGYIHENCVVENCKLTGNISGNSYVGGICGYLAKNSMLNLCRATGNISGEEFVGGLVGYTQTGGTILTSFTEVSVLSDGNYTGGLTGFSNGEIENCQVGSPANIASIKGVDYVGGLTGHNGGKIEGCRTNADVSGRNSVGGICGYAALTSVAIQCCAKTDVNGITRVGGFSGYNTGQISNCYALGEITGTSAVGGFIGEFHNEITNSYASVQIHGGVSNIGGFLGTNNGTATTCYWNISINQGVASVGYGSDFGIEAKNTEDFTDFNGTVIPRDIFVGWDFANIWENEVPISLNEDFPGLKFEFNFEKK